MVIASLPLPFISPRGLAEPVYPSDHGLTFIPSIRVFHNGPRRFGDYHTAITSYPCTTPQLLPPSDLKHRTVAQAIRLAREILNSDSGIASLSLLARNLFALNPESVRIVNGKEIQSLPRRSPTVAKNTTQVPGHCPCLHHLDQRNAQQQIPPSPGLICPSSALSSIDKLCFSGCEHQGIFEDDCWDRRVAKQYISIVNDEWPDVLIDETLQWPTNFANVERRPWGAPEGDDGRFIPRQFRISLNAPRIHSIHESPADEMCRYMFQLVITMVHEVGGHLFVTYLSKGRAHTPQAMKHPNYYPTVYEGAAESGRFLELALFGGALIFAGDGSTRFRQGGEPYLVAPNGLARRIVQSAIYQTVSGDFHFPFPVEGPELEYYRLPFLCGADPELESSIARKEQQRMKRDAIKKESSPRAC